ncbi:MAG: hypothetical protein NC093_10485 [Alistipes sp.]|nr:hypothetical protein [Alistipes sp.]
MTSNEKNALRFYIGDVSGSHKFYGDPKAYVTINSLFFPGISTEKLRVGEGKPLNPEIAADITRLLDFFGNLFAAFGKCTVESRETWRVERFADYEIMAKYGATVSLTSTSTAGFLSSYRDRAGISLMRFSLAEGSPAINVANELDFYVKPEEAEILLPPFMELRLSELPMTERELSMIDRQNKPPRLYCKAEFTGEIADFTKTVCASIEDSACAVNVLKKISSGQEPEGLEVQEYCLWKDSLRCRLREMLKCCIK